VILINGLAISALELGETRDTGAIEVSRLILSYDYMSSLNI